MSEGLVKEALEIYLSMYRNLTNASVRIACDVIKEVVNILERVGIGFGCSELRSTIQQFKELTNAVCEGFRKCCEELVSKTRREYEEMLKLAERLGKQTLGVM